MNRWARLLLAAAAIAGGLIVAGDGATAHADPPVYGPAAAGCIAAGGTASPVPGSRCPDGSTIGADGQPHDPASIPAGCAGSTQLGPPSAGYVACPDGPVLVQLRLIVAVDIPSGCPRSRSDELPVVGTVCPDGSVVDYPAGCSTASSRGSGLGIPGTLCPDGSWLDSRGSADHPGDIYYLPTGCRGSKSLQPAAPGTGCPDGTVVGGDGHWQLPPMPAATALCRQLECTPTTGTPAGGGVIPAGCAGSTSSTAPIPGTACPDGTIVASLGGSDDGDDAATGSGLDSLLPSGSFTDGNAPTLAETYPASAYSWSSDYGVTDAWRHPVGFVVNGIWGGAVLVTYIATYLFQLVFSANPLSLLDNGWLGQLTNRLANVILYPLLALGSAAAGLRALIQIKTGRTARGIGIILGSVAAVAVTIMVLSGPEQVVDTGQQASSQLLEQMAGVGCNPATTACTTVGDTQAAMFPDVTPTFQQPAAPAARRQAVDRFHWAFVVVPWATGEFGSVDAAGDGWAQKYLHAAVTGQSTKAVTADWKDAGHGTSSEKNWVNGKNLQQRAIIAAVALIAALAMAIFLIGAAAMIFGAYIGMLYVIVFGAFAGAVAPLSERGFLLWKRWIGYLAAQFVKRTVVVAFVMLLVEVVAAINTVLARQSYFLNVMWMFFTLVGAFVWRRTFVTMFVQLLLPGAKPSNSGSAIAALGAGAAYGMMRRNSGAAGAAQGGSTPLAPAGMIGRPAGTAGMVTRTFNPWLAGAAVGLAVGSKATGAMQESAAPLMLDGQSTHRNSSGLAAGVLAAAAFGKPGLRPAKLPPPTGPPAAGPTTPPPPSPPAGGQPALPQGPIVVGPRPAAALLDAARPALPRGPLVAGPGPYSAPQAPAPAGEATPDAPAARSVTFPAPTTAATAAANAAPGGQPHRTGTVAATKPVEQPRPATIRRPAAARPGDPSTRRPTAPGTLLDRPAVTGRRARPGHPVEVIIDPRDLAALARRRRAR